MEHSTEGAKTLRALFSEGFGPSGATLAFNLFAIARLALLKLGGGRKIAYAAPEGVAAPKRLWIFWAQGLDAAPPVVRRCVESWERENPTWRVSVLDEQAAAALVDLSDLPANLSIAHRSDVLRLRLLARYGGVWADATAFCARPLDQWLDLACQSGFFAFARPGPDRLLANWFLAASPAHPLVTAWEARLSRYYVVRGKPPPAYHAAHYQFHLALLASRGLRRLWRDTPQISADRMHMALALLRGRIPESDQALRLVAAAPVNKLSYKDDLDIETFAPLLARAADVQARDAAETGSSIGAP